MSTKVLVAEFKAPIVQPIEKIRLINNRELVEKKNYIFNDVFDRISLSVNEYEVRCAHGAKKKKKSYTTFVIFFL